MISDHVIWLCSSNVPRTHSRPEGGLLSSQRTPHQTTELVSSCSTVVFSLLSCMPVESDEDVSRPDDQSPGPCSSFAVHPPSGASSGSRHCSTQITYLSSPSTYSSSPSSSPLPSLLSLSSLILPGMGSDGNAGALPVRRSTQFLTGWWLVAATNNRYPSQSPTKCSSSRPRNITQSPGWYLSLIAN